MESINILCATDNKYAPFCGVMLTSLFATAQDSVYHVYIFTDSSISTKNREKFLQLACDYSSIIQIIDVDNSMLDSCPINSETNITLPTYYRLLAPQILPNNIHRIIYLDCDLIIKGDLLPIWKIDMTEKAIASVVDCEAYNESIYHRLDNFTSSRDYFNAGVSIYNLDYWRKNGLVQKAFNYLSCNSEKLYWMDQDILNVILNDSKISLNMEYNFETLFFLPKNWSHYNNDLKNEILTKSHSPIIVHYNGPSKPWSFRYYGAPFYDEWDQVCRCSLWKKCRIKKPIIKYCKYLIKRYLLRSVLRHQIYASWIIVPENQHCYHV